MTDSLLKHSECGGSVFIDISPLLRFCGPGMSINPKGISIPVFEILGKKQSGGAIFFCSKCKKEGFPEDFMKHIEASCLVCGETKPVTELATTYFMPILCKSCIDILTGKNEPKTSKQKRVFSILNVGEELDFCDLSKVLAKVII